MDTVTQSYARNSVVTGSYSFTKLYDPLCLKFLNKWIIHFRQTVWSLKWILKYFETVWSPLHAVKFWIMKWILTVCSPPGETQKRDHTVTSQDDWGGNEFNFNVFFIDFTDFYFNQMLGQMQLFSCTFIKVLILFTITIQFDSRKVGNSSNTWVRVESI